MIRVAFAVATDISSLRSFAVHKFTLVVFEILTVGSDTDARTIVLVVVEHGLNTVLELRIIRDLNDDIAIHDRCLVLVPDNNGVDVELATEIDLHPLRPLPEQDHILVPR